MRYSRREFLAGMRFVLGAAVCGLSLPARAAGAPRLIVGAGETVCAVDLNGERVLSVPVGFKPHGFAQHPLQAERVWAFEKWGGGAAEVDCHSGKVTRRLQAAEETQFFGHGMFTADGGVLFAVREDLSTGLGHCIGYDSRNFAQVMDYQVTPGGLHECHLLPDHTFLVASNGAPVIYRNGMVEHRPMIERSSLVHVDPARGEVRDKKFVADDDQFLGHFAVTRNGTIVALSSARRDAARQRGAIYCGHVARPGLERVALPDELDVQLRGEMLSIAVDEARHMAIVTNPGGSRMLFVDTASGVFLGALENKANGVAFDSTLERFILNLKGLQSIQTGSPTLHDLQVNGIDGQVFALPFDGAHSIMVDLTGV